MQTYKTSDIPYIIIRICTKCDIFIFRSYDPSNKELCPTCNSPVTFVADHGHESVNTLISVLQKQILEKDERIQSLETQLKLLETRLTKIKFSPPKPLLQNGGPEFQKIIQEAKDEGDFN